MALKMWTANTRHDDVEMTIEKIGPNEAADLLENVGNNRPVNEKAVNDYARQMKEGMWKVTGEPIIVDKYGRLTDGQHRLWAVIQSGVTITTPVVRGVDQEVFNFTDQGRSRTDRDVLAINGYSYPGPLATAAKYLMNYEGHGDFRSTDAGRSKIPAYTVLDFVKNNPGLVDDVSMAHRVSVAIRGYGYSTALVTALMQVLKSVDEEDAEAFFECLETGFFTVNDRPIHVLRERVAKNIPARQGGMNGNYLAAITIKAWNAWRQGTDIRVLKFSPGGSRAEQFPVPV